MSTVVCAYINDLLVLSTGMWKEHKQHLDEVLMLLQKAGMKVQAKGLSSDIINQRVPRVLDYRAEHDADALECAGNKKYSLNYSVSFTKDTKKSRVARKAPKRKLPVISKIAQLSTLYCKTKG